MYSSPELIVKYLSYYINAANSRGHGIHSPFVFNFITKVLNDRSQYVEYSSIESLRRQLHRDKTVLQVTDFGAGSRLNATDKRKISEISKQALKPQKYAALLFRMVRYFQPDTIVELGTSLGITTAYLATARPGTSVTTLEGSPEIAAEAKKVFEKLAISNITQLNGHFNDTIEVAIARHTKVDFLFIDGNHRYQPTIQYFESFLSVATENTIIVLDDIHWSREMENAWQYCRKHPSVRLSIDLFFIGILFFRKDFRVPQHFSIRF